MVDCDCDCNLDCCGLCGACRFGCFCPGGVEVEEEGWIGMIAAAFMGCGYLLHSNWTRAVALCNASAKQTSVCSACKYACCCLCCCCLCCVANIRGIDDKLKRVILDADNRTVDKTGYQPTEKARSVIQMVNEDATDIKVIKNPSTLWDEILEQTEEAGRKCDSFTYLYKNEIESIYD